MVMGNRLKLVCALLLLPWFASAQTFSQRFDEAISRNDSLVQREILSQWEVAKPEDADLKLAYFNFYKQRYLLEPDSLVKEALLTDAFFHIDQGIAQFPSRLDLPLSKISLLWDLGRYADYKQTILTVLEHNDGIKDKWLWKNNRELVNSTDFLLQYVDNYVVQLYNLGEESVHPYMDELANRVLKSYPQHVPSLSNLAITAMYHQDYQRAVDYLSKALSIENTNTSVLSNLAYAHSQIGNTETAISYYEQAAKYGDSETKDHVRQQLEKLRNQK